MRHTLFLLLLVALVSGCGGESSPPETQPVQGPDTFGQELFEERVVGANPGCVTCHSLLNGVTIVGPSLHTVESPVPGMTEADYVREAIVNPDAYIAEGFSAGQMNAGWDELLSDEQIESLVEFLLGTS